MADQPIKKNAAFTFYLPGLVDQSNTKVFKTAPTIAAGDFKISKDGGAFANPDTLPDVEPDGTTQVRIQLTATEMNADQITLKFQDASGAEWCDGSLMIFTSSAQMADLNTSLTTLLSRIVGTLLTGNHNPQSGDAYAVVTNGTYGLSAVKTLIDTITNRIGAFTGSGINTILGFFKSLASKTASAPSDMGGTYDPTTDALEALHDNGISVTATVALTYNEMQSIADAAAGIDVSIMRHVDYAKTFGSLTISASWTKMYLTIKRTKDEADASAQLQLMVTNPADSGADGATYVNGAAGGANRTKGGLTVSQGAGTVAVALNDELTALLNAPAKGNWYYDIKQVTASGTSLLSRGLVAVTDAVTRAVS